MCHETGAVIDGSLTRGSPPYMATLGLLKGGTYKMCYHVRIIYRASSLLVSVPFQHLESCDLLPHARVPEQMQWAETLAHQVTNDTI